MFRVVPQPLNLSELAQIYAWRVMLFATRRMHRFTTRWVPIVIPVIPFLWVPVMALFLGAFLGWSIVR